MQRGGILSNKPVRDSLVKCRHVVYRAAENVCWGVQLGFRIRTPEYRKNQTLTPSSSRGGLEVERKHGR